MMHFFTFLISILALIDYNHGLNCYYCFPCNGANARIVTCAPDKTFCSLLKGTDPVGDVKTLRRCEASSTAVSGNCYSNNTYEDYTNVQACLCNTDGCNIDYSTFTTATTTIKTTTTPTTTKLLTTITTPTTTKLLTTITTSKTSQTSIATTTISQTSTSTTTTTTSKVIVPTQPSGGMGPTTLLGATLPPGLTFPSTVFQPLSFPPGGATPTSFSSGGAAPTSFSSGGAAPTSLLPGGISPANYPNVSSDRLSPLSNQQTTFWNPFGISTVQATQNPAITISSTLSTLVGGNTTTATNSGITPQLNYSKASKNFQSRWLAVIAVVFFTVTLTFV